MSSHRESFETLQYFAVTDAKDITWAHAVNSKEKLEEFLRTDISMFEADVLMRYNRNDTTPVMAHPPANDSDLTLQAFLNSMKPTRKGIKLDFKSIMAVQPAMQLLKSAIFNETDRPVWLNADILKGPGANAKSNPPVDADDFITICTSAFPNATLSLGWTTSWSDSIVTSGYTQAMVEEMEAICRNTTQMISFPIRAVYVRRSWVSLKWLLDTNPRYSLTIWSAVNDHVDVEDLVWLTKQIDKRRLYIDIPTKLDNDFRTALANQGTSPSTICYTVYIVLTFFLTQLFKW